MTDTRRTGVIPANQYGPARMIFAYTDHMGRLAAVIDAEDINDAWLFATGWGDARDIEEKKRAGWKVTPAMLDWKTND